MSLLFDLDRSTDEDGPAGASPLKQVRPRSSSESDSDDEWLRGRAYGEWEEEAVPLDEEEDPLDDDDDDGSGDDCNYYADAVGGRLQASSRAASSSAVFRTQSPSRPIVDDRPQLGRAKSLLANSSASGILAHSFSGSSSPDDSPKKAKLKRKEKSERSLVRLLSNPQILISSVKKERSGSRAAFMQDAQSSTSKYYFRSMILESSCSIITVLLSPEVLKCYNKQEQLYILYCITDICLVHEFLGSVVETVASTAPAKESIEAFATALRSEMDFPPYSLEVSPLRKVSWWHIVQMGLYHITIHTRWVQSALEPVIRELNHETGGWHEERQKSRFSLKKSKRQKTLRHKVFPFVQRFLYCLFQPSLATVPTELLHFLFSLHNTVEGLHAGSGVSFLKHALVGLLLSPCVDAPGEYGVMEEPLSGAASALTLFPIIIRDVLCASQSGSDKQDIQADLAIKCANRFNKFIAKAVRWDPLRDLQEKASLGSQRSQYVLSAAIGRHLEEILDHAVEHNPEVAMKCGQFASLGLEVMSMDD